MLSMIVMGYQKILTGKLLLSFMNRRSIFISKFNLEFCFLFFRTHKKEAADRRKSTVFGDQAKMIRDTFGKGVKTATDTGMKIEFWCKKGVKSYTVRTTNDVKKEAHMWQFAGSCKGQLISKCLFGIFNSPKKTNEKIPLYYYGTSSRIIFVCFLGELKTPKRHFKIN